MMGRESPRKDPDRIFPVVTAVLGLIIIFTAGCTTSSILKQYSPEPTTASPTPTPTNPAGTMKDQNIATIKNIIEQYHQTHTYNLTDMYACAQMAQDVWDMVETKGINASIEIGNISQDITRIQQSDHAWVLAEVSPGEWIAMETTGGYLVCNDTRICAVNNTRYYTGWTFNTPRELQTYMMNPSGCDAGYVLGTDDVCHPACGANTYCTGNSVCVNQKCMTCRSGYVIGQDLQCHPACGSSYCSGNSACVSGQCVTCNSGYILGSDNQCHAACGTDTYCSGDSACVNGQCVTCPAGYYLGTDLRCHKS